MLLSLLLRPLVGISHSGLREKVRDNDYYRRYPIALRDNIFTCVRSTDFVSSIRLTLCTC
jgi:hypothetical protein